MRQWSYSAGKNKTGTEPSSRVRVYTRADLPGRLFMTRAWVLTPSGRPVELILAEGTTTKAAEALADSTAAERRLAILEGRSPVGQRRAVTVSELLEAYDSWLASQDRSKKTLEDKAICRKFWLGVLGSTKAEDLTTAEVVRIAAMARKRDAEKPRLDPRQPGVILDPVARRVYEIMVGRLEP